ncbi:hypothetical protein SDC9_183844 [bioreactor metagenome]|uniref:Uncharacterized protein n=1 Tax=bioreactor metagenome TaxID=1076179 RepID=A0A645HBC8_9ZZZZ
MNFYIAFRRRGHGQNILQRNFGQKMFFRIIENLSYRGMILSHYTLHAVKGPKHMRGIDHIASAYSDKDILVTVGHSDNLVRYDLSDRQDEIV